MVACRSLDDPLVEIGELRFAGLRADLAPDILQRFVAVVEAPGVELRDGLGEAGRRSLLLWSRDQRRGWWRRASAWQDAGGVDGPINFFRARRRRWKVERSATADQAMH